MEDSQSMEAGPAPGLNSGPTPGPTWVERPLLCHAVALLWGAAEATLFFFVPDVFLTRLALERPRRAALASVFALAGALIGGVCMHALGADQSAAVAGLLERIPAIDAALIARVRTQLETHGPEGLFLGVPRGVPYKLYAFEWGRMGGALGPFLLVSVPARLLRFLALVGLAALVARLWPGRRSPRARAAVHLALWFAFYAGYFYVMRG